MLRMLLIGYAYGIRSERQLCSEVHLNLAYRWFCRLGLDGAVPNHSTFSKNRYGRFRESDVYCVLFEEVVGECCLAGLVTSEGFAVNGSLISSDAARTRRVEVWTRSANGTAAGLCANNWRHSMPAILFILAKPGISPTDPAAAWNVKEGRGKFGYFNNYLIDTEHTVIVDVEATPARLSQEIVTTKAMLERVDHRHALRPEQLAAYKAYGMGPFRGWLSQRSIVPHIPLLDRQHQTDGLLPREVFTFDPNKNHYTCPQNKILKSATAPADAQVQRYHAKESDCRSCPIRQQCTRSRFRCLSVSVDEGVRQQTKALQATEPFQQSRRLRKKVDMLFAHMKQQFRFTRLRLRGLSGASEECLLMATVQNLRRLVRLRRPAMQTE